MWEFLDRFFGDGFMPHGHCYLWTPSMVWTQVCANLVIGLSYVSITATLAVLVRRIRKLPFMWAFVAFGVFILSCGLTHFMDMVTVWHPVYWADAGVRVLTAVASAFTAVLIIPLVSRAQQLAGAAQLAADRGRELEIANRSLEEAKAHLAQRAESKEVEFRELIDNLPELAWTAQPDGHIDFFNRRWFDYTGTAPDDDRPNGWHDVHDPEQLPRVLATWKHSLETGEPFEMEFPLRGADGVFRWFLTRVRPLRHEGKVVRWFGSNTNIDDRRKEGEALKAAIAQAEEATRLKDEFLAAVSHELRTPLNAILGWSRMLASGHVPPQQMANAVATIERNTLAQVELIDDLLDLSRIITGKFRMEVETVDVQHTVDAAIDSLRPAIEARGIQLEMTRAPEGTSVRGDPARLQQVLWNILGNAVKFSGKDGRVAVTVAAVGSQVVMTVRDWGKGIRPDFLPRVFDRFRQADGSTTRAFGGLGLGLAITKQIVELHGGTITVASEGEGKGACVTVTLAREESVAQASRGASLVPRASAAPSRETPAELIAARILVVDDDADSRELLKAVLEHAGAVVTTAASSQEALAAIADHAPEAIIADIGMPDENGYEFIAKARQLLTSDSVPAAALTAFARAEDRRRALAAGFQMHLAKPIDPAELTATVANLIRLRRP